MGFDKVGFFHFVHNHVEPIPELAAALDSEKTRDCICNSLIVLPEAFNVRKNYKAKGNSNYDPSILAELQTLSRTFHVTFIAGLIIKQYGGPEPPCSSAYLIDETCCVLVCHKNNSDKNEHNTPYSKCENHYDHQNPIWHSGVCVVVLICVDSDDYVRKTALLANFPDTNKIICIPACMGRGQPTTCISVASNWSDHYVIFANSDPNGIGSFMSKHGTIIVGPEMGNSNKLILAAVT
jgi:hypothetical protein